MELSKDQLMQFAKVVNEDTKPVKNGITVEGTAVLYGGKIYVRLDGSDQLTPVISSTAGMKDGDRVTVMIKDHSATVTGNVSSPSAGKQDVDDAKTEIGNKITELEVVIADKVSVKEFDAEKARIDSLTADNVVIKDKLTATDAEIKDLKATNVTINGQLTANKAEIDDLKVNKLDASVADLKFATIENLNATNADIHNLNVDYGEFKKLTAGDIQAHEAEINKLTTEKLSATEADLKYANIDFANIGEAAIKKLFSDSGIIKDLVVSQGHITGELVGVTIKGDLIEGGTVKADKLVVKGTDGLYYKLNTDGEKVSAQQTEYNSLNGSIITAKSVTAEKVNVDDLVAFGATIGGFHIDNHALYSGVKSSIDNTTRGTFMNDDGEFAIGDQSNYLKFYRDTDGTYKLAISAKEIKMSSTNVSIETIVGQVQNDVNDLKAEAIKTTQEQFYPSTSPTELVGGYWSSTQPTWTDGIYLWRRTLVTYVSGDTAYTPSLKGVCITGNTGEAGSTGVGIASIADRFYLSDSNVELKGGSWVTVRPDWVQGKYIWTRYLITYTDGSTEQTYPVCVTGPTGNSGTGVSDVDVVYAKSSSNTEPPTSGWQTTTPPWEDGKYIWSKTITKYTNNQSVESAPVCITGSKGQTGDRGPQGLQGIQGAKGEQGIQGPPGQNGSNGSTSYFHIKYSAVSNPTSASQMTETPNTYIGTYVDFTSTDSTDPTKYTWSRFQGIQGSKGEDGIPGKNGADGKTSYLHIAYANSADGSNGFSTTDSVNKLYIGQYTDFTQADSTDRTRYSWSKIKGEQGQAGSNGKDGLGVSSVDVQYAKSSSNTEPPTSGWQTVAPAWEDGKYIWSKTITRYTDESSAESSPVCITGGKGSTGANGQPGANGAPGIGIKSIVEQYYQSTSPTTQTGGSWVSSYPAWVDGKYLWTRSVITYTDESVKQTPAICVSGSKGQTGAAGANGKPGADGNGIKSTEVTYQASVSQTSAPTGSWSTSVPKLSTATPYLWTKTVITYTDGKTSTSYSVSSTLDGVEVGGRNFVLKSNIGGEAHNPNTYDCAKYAMSIDRLEVNGVYTVQINATTTADRKNIGLYMNKGNMSLTPWLKTNEGTHTYTSTFVFSKGQADAVTNSTLIVFSSNVLNENQGDVPITGTCDVHWIKLERGNKATDWTPAPEDIRQDIDNAQNKVDNMTETVTKTSAELKVLSDSISSLVTDAKGQSLMTQTGSGWTFNIGSIQSALNGAIGDIQDVKGDIEGVNDLANKTNQLANDVAAKTAYINMTQDESGQPVMELGQQNGEFKLRITNTSMDFMQGSQKIAYLSNRQLYIQSSVVTDEMKIGATSGYIWKKRGNGNMGLRYVSN